MKRTDPLADMRAATIRRVSALERSFEGIVEAAADVATDDEHDPEGHTIAWERQQVAALLIETRAALDDIERAIRRVAAGEYGTCSSCGNAISSARLDALPATPHCVTCAR